MTSIQKKILNFIDNLCQILFSNGWGFIFPYVLFYLYSLYSHSPIEPLFNIFIILHIFNFLLLIYFIYQNKNNLKLKKIIFWLIISLIFIIPGVYLEYPADPWSHFERIFSFQNTDFIAESDIKHKFSYFFAWALMSKIEPINRRLALNIYSTFWQLLFSYQFYLLALKLGIDKYWSKILVISVLFLFGTSSFSFRYYDISSTVVAQIAYIASIIALLNIKERKYQGLLLLIPLLIIMYCNHIQSVMFFIISTFALTIDYSLSKNRQYTIISLIIIFIIAYILGYYAIHYTQLGEHRLWNLKNPSYLTLFGSLKIWNPDFSYFQTAGLHGIIGLVFAIVFFKKYQTIALLTLTPYALLIFPPFVYYFATKLSETSSYSDMYRALYAFPTSLIFILGLKEILPIFLNKIKQINLAKNNQLLSIIIVLIIILIPPYQPFRGRFYFQIYKVPAQLSLQNIDITAQWFYENRKLNNSCLLASDRVTQFAIITHFGLQDQPPHRTVPYNISNEIKTKQDLDTYIQSKNVCKFLIAQPDKLPNIPSSKVAQISGHWDANLVKYNMTLTSEYTQLVDTLTETGWQKTFVPPFYYLYEKPQ